MCLSDRACPFLPLDTSLSFTRYCTSPPPPSPEDEVDPAQIEADMARLALIKAKREADRLKRIEDEGFDRYAPVGSDQAK